MEFNIDILVAGCNTNCLHCYANGGPSKQMPIKDYEFCIERLIPVFQHFGTLATFTLDNEPYNHPDFSKILTYVRERCWNNYYHHGSTTGIAFNHRIDKHEIWDQQRDYDIAFGSITLHGGERNHNFITQNSKAFSEAMNYIDFIKKNDGKLYISLMLSKLLIEDRDEITRIITEIKPDGVYLAIPNCAPSNRMQNYQKYRPTYDECLLLKGYLSTWGLDEDTILTRFIDGRSSALLRDLIMQGDFDFVQPEQCYLTIHPDLNLYIGNSGVETRLIGNVRDLTSKAIIEAMKNASANYNFFSSCFKELPEFEKFIKLIQKSIIEDLVYPDMDSFLTYHLFHNKSF